MGGASVGAVGDEGTGAGRDSWRNLAAFWLIGVLK